MSELIVVLEKDVFNYVEILEQHSFLNSDTVRDGNASRLELEQLLAKENLFRGEVRSSFIKLYKTGSKNLSSSEWNAVKRQLKHLIN